MILKVYGASWTGRSRRVVATTSKKRAAELIGIDLYFFNDYASETGNKEEIELAMSKPETVFEKPDQWTKGPWKEIKK